MTTPSDSWCVKYHIQPHEPGGPYGFMVPGAESEWDARFMAQARSREHGHAWVFHNNDLVAEYVNGELRTGTGVSA